MDSNIQKALWLGVGILFFVAVVSTGLFLFGKGKAVASSSGDQLDGMTKQLSEIEYADYDNVEITGNDVVNALRKYKGEGGRFIIEVTTLNGTFAQYISSGTVTGGILTSPMSALTLSIIEGSLKNAQSISHGSYINPLGRFAVTLVYDKNRVVRGISAVQQ
ncbi:hypothetical protein [Anaerotalea alkaliphila]|uniref:Uncharacterized protein n=1 Tax=Anaerotalea alkaliphila TaxID=2662126 RepID=A0A7X5HTJ0_9FIRM|nr:hypothetical protein [Anaerotalea alkaliphila]NDL66381.1 hypothetical protein [Anaerotalea alkaliphila]